MSYSITSEGMLGLLKKAIRDNGGIIFEDDMNDPNIYRYDLGGDDNSLHQFCDGISYGGGGSIKITTPPVSGKRVTLGLHIFTPLQPEKVTYEVIVTVPRHTHNFRYLEIDMAYHKGTPSGVVQHRWDAGIRINYSDTRFEYLASAAPTRDWTTIPGGTDQKMWVGYVYDWHKLRVTANFKTMKYISCSFDDLEFDLRDLDLDLAFAGLNHNVWVLSFNVRCEALINAATPSYIGRIRILEEV